MVHRGMFKISPDQNFRLRLQYTDDMTRHTWHLVLIDLDKLTYMREIFTTYLTAHKTILRSKHYFSIFLSTILFGLSTYCVPLIYFYGSPPFKKNILSKKIRAKLAKNIAGNSGAPADPPDEEHPAVDDEERGLGALQSLQRQKSAA